MSLKKTTLTLLISFAFLNVFGDVIKTDTSLPLTIDMEVQNDTAYSINVDNQDGYDIYISTHSFITSYAGKPYDSAYTYMRAMASSGKIVMKGYAEQVSSNSSFDADSIKYFERFHAHWGCDPQTTSCGPEYFEHPGYVKANKKFIGFSFQRDNKTHYGYVALKFAGGEPGTGVTKITGWAYEDEPNTPILTGDPATKLVQGTVYEDENTNCQLDSTQGESGMSGITIKGTDGNTSFYANTDSAGLYNLKMPDTNVTYNIYQALDSDEQNYITQNCPNAPSYHEINTASFSGDTTGLDYGNTVQECSYLTVSVNAAASPRPCFDHNITVEYKNEGPSAANNAKLYLIQDGVFNPKSSTPSWDNKKGDSLIYNLGTVEAGASGKVHITDSVDCNTDLTGFGKCVKARVTPRTQCGEYGDPSPEWDGSGIYFTRHKCMEDTARFTIKNRDTANAMSAASEYRIYLNDTLVHSDNFNLSSGEDFDIKVPANGQVIRAEADQHPAHPGNSRPRKTIQACGSSLENADKGYVLNTSKDDKDPFTDINCWELVNSFDPNDKLVTPAGMTENNYIDSTTTLNYTVRFQNTGTAPARKVVILDTLDEDLNPSTMAVTGNSHDMKWEISGSNADAVLKFTFKDINLPDSTSNEPESHGYVSFRVEQDSNNNTGTVIKNKAGIYFDYNEPVITNTVTHEVNNDYPAEDQSKGEGITDSRVTAISNGSRITEGISVYPNPSGGKVNILSESNNVTSVRVYNTDGRLMEQYDQAPENINLSGYSRGTYILAIQTRNEVIHRKIIKQ